MPFLPSPIPDAERAQLDMLLKHADPCLRSAKEVIRYNTRAQDGEVGHLDDFLLEEEPWRIACIVIDTGKWILQSKVLISSEHVSDIVWHCKRVTLDITRQTVHQSSSLRTGGVGDPTGGFNPTGIG